MPRDDPLEMAGLDPSAVSAAVESKSKGKLKQPSELDIKKEERLSQKEQRLSAGAPGPSKAAAASVPPVVPAPPDPGPIVDKLNAYRERFPHLKSRNKITAKSTVDELLDELHYLELQMGSNRDSTTGTKIFVAAMSGLEYTTHFFNPLGLELHGLGQIARNNAGEFKDIMDELLIKYSVNFYMQPEWRLVLSVGALVMTVHGANTGDSRVGETLQKMGQGVQVPDGAGEL